MPPKGFRTITVSKRLFTRLELLRKTQGYKSPNSFLEAHFGLARK